MKKISLIISVLTVSIIIFATSSYAAPSMDVSLENISGKPIPQNYQTIIKENLEERGKEILQKIDTQTISKVQVLGTIQVLTKENKKFTGYGVSTHTTVANCQLRIKIIDSKTNKVLFSKRNKDKSVRFNPNAGDDLLLEAIENTIESI